jgi:DNA-binding FadR family transcriptional regulator
MSETKTAMLLRLLREDWIGAADLCQRFGWASHTLRGALSTIAKKQAVKIERRRLNGVTSYRIVAPIEQPSEWQTPSVVELQA